MVNQPRLTTEDDQVITISDGNVEFLVDEAENDQVIKYIYSFIFYVIVYLLIFSIFFLFFS